MQTLQHWVLLWCLFQRTWKPKTYYRINYSSANSATFWFCCVVDFKEHINQKHTGENPFPCKLCNIGFCSVVDFKEHINQKNAGFNRVFPQPLLNTRSVYIRIPPHTRAGIFKITSTVRHFIWNKHLFFSPSNQSERESTNLTVHFSNFPPLSQCRTAEMRSWKYYVLPLAYHTAIIMA